MIKNRLKKLMNINASLQIILGGPIQSKEKNKYSQEVTGDKEIILGKAVESDLRKHNKMAAMNTHLSITVSINGLNSPKKETDYIRKQGPDGW